MGSRWYAAQTKSGMAQFADTHLKRQGFDAFLPEAGDIPLFPGYIFVAFDRESVRWRSVNFTVGVVKLLPLYAEMPLPLPVGYIEDLQADLARGQLNGKTAEETLFRYMPGDFVEVHSGLWAGHHGKMVGYQKGSIRLLMALLGQEWVIPVPLHQVESRAKVERATVR